MNKITNVIYDQKAYDKTYYHIQQSRSPGLQEVAVDCNHAFDISRNILEDMRCPPLISPFSSYFSP
jgi:hypothetical protein